MNDASDSVGFTLIEILIVIALIAILSVLGLASYIASQQYARNARRSGDLKTLQGALEQYYANNTSYPVGCNFGWQTAQYFPQGVPLDPKTGNQYIPLAGSCNGTGYCYCVRLEPPTTTSGNSNVNNCTNYVRGSYFCVQNLQ